MYLPVLLNAMVHVLMYLHYLLTAIGVHSWWRPYLTSIQILQFVAISIQSYIAYQGGPFCGAPDFAKVLLMLYMGSMLLLFVYFFIQRYILQKETSTIAGVIKSVNQQDTFDYYGTVHLDTTGKAVALVPIQLALYEREFTYHLTAVGKPMPNLHLEQEISLKTSKNTVFIIAGGLPKGRVSWHVTVCTKSHSSLQKQKSL